MGESRTSTVSFCSNDGVIIERNCFLFSMEVLQCLLCLLSLCSEKCTVYIGSHSHQFVALSVSSGVALWQTYLGDRIESSAALSLCRKFLVVGESFVFSHSKRERIDVHCIPKTCHPLVVIISSNFNQFSKFFHCFKACYISNKMVITFSTTPKICCHTTLRN